MDITSFLVNTASDMSAQKTQYEASIKMAKNALDVQKQAGDSVLKLLESGDVNKATAGAATGSNLDLLA
ncbi:MAG: hypothetical protein C0602_01495 [Denitrovibrio sp.]|nr:MAG: hypothetical protein C0602_01495 [Denitrovibrio sp.]